MIRLNKNILKIIVVILIVIIVIFGVYLILKKENKPNYKTKSLVPRGTTSTPISHSLPKNNSLSSGGVVNQNNYSATSSLPPSSEWKSSSNNIITLQSPTEGSILKSGDPLIGLSSISPVQFLLVDNSVGQIAQGTLNVVNGKFDETIQFTPHSSSGVLQIYYPNPNNGAEEDIVNINVNF